MKLLRFHIKPRLRNPKWYQVIDNANIVILLMFMKYKFLILSFWRTWRRSGVPSPGPATLQVDNEKSFTHSVMKSPKNSKRSNICFHYCDKNKHNNTDWRANAKFKKQKKADFKDQARPERFSGLLVSFLKKFMHLKGSWSMENL
jgi:hypothetical protein